MKTIRNILGLAVVLVVVTVGVASCEEKENYPIEIPFTEYSLEGTSCQWRNLNYESLDYEGNLIVVNSNDELENYINCTEGSYLEVDFSKNTLLLASGLAQNQIEEIKNITFSKSATNEYILNIIIHLGVERAIDQWSISIIIPKIANNAIVELDVYQSQFIDQ